MENKSKGDIMKTMKTNVKGKTLSVLGLSLGIIMFLLVNSAKPVHADPHAMFLTVIGQQQLFFNVLAALNQADYVESLQIRQQLAQKRDQSYVPSTAQALTDTQTNLANLLTRDVTLEGQDVATQERADEFGKEVVRQQRLATLIDQLCREAFGSEQCQFKEKDFQDPNPSERLTSEKDRAFIQDPVEYSSLPITLGGLSALYSGTAERRKDAEDILTLPHEGGPTLPLAYSPEIADLRDKLGKDDPALLQKFEGIVLDVAQELGYLEPEIDVGAWVQELQGNNGGVNPETDLETANQVINGYGSATNAVVSLREALLKIADSAQSRVATQLNDTLVDGAIPDRVHKVEAGIGNDEFGEIGTLVSAPANVKVGLQQQLLPLLAQIEGDPEFVDPNQIDNLAGESAVDREDAQGNKKPPLKIGTPLEEFAKADVIEKGLLEQSGVTHKLFENLRSRNTLQKFLEDMFNQGVLTK